MSAWIKCSDKMPDNGKYVLFWHTDGFMRFGRWEDPYEWMTGPRDEYEVGSWWAGDWSYEAPNVTHWMPLPEPPTE